MTASSKAQLMTKSSATDIYEYLTTLIKQATKSYLIREQISLDIEELPIDLRFSAQSSFGDYSMPVMPWASKNKLGRPPLSIAEQLASADLIKFEAALKQIDAANNAHIDACFLIAACAASGAWAAAIAKRR